MKELGRIGLGEGIAITRLKGGRSGLGARDRLIFGRTKSRIFSMWAADQTVNSATNCSQVPDGRSLARNA